MIANPAGAADREYLVVGADGLIGAALVACLNNSGARVTGTSRRRGPAKAGQVFLDLSAQQDFNVESGRYSCAFLCAAMTNIAACEAEPERARALNVTNTLLLAQKLLTAGTSVVFLSSSSVFNGNTPWPAEDADYSPCVEYGKQKAAAEQGLVSMAGSKGTIAIVRISKVLSPVSGMAAEFIRCFKSNEPCRAFRDLRMAPVSLDYVSRALVTIAFNRLAGVFHLSGSEEISYAEFASRLAAHIGAAPVLVRPGTSTDAGVTVLYRPEHPGLGMKRTGALLEIEPESTTHLMSDLVASTG